MISLWHDDVRPPPEGWIWVRTNEEAKKVLLTGNVASASLDHDMGNHDCEAGAFDACPGSGLPQKGDETGYDLVLWMIEHAIIPTHVRIHAWNPSGGRRMYQALLDIGANVVYRPFQSSEV